MRKLTAFSLASSGEKCLINTDNIAFVLPLTGEDDEKKLLKFSRVYLKALAIDNEEKWIDVQETLEEIRRKC